MMSEMSEEALEAALLDRGELIAALRQQALFWAQEYSNARNEIYKLKRENAHLKTLAHKAAEIVLAPRQKAV